jgi:hypothetical protein
VPLPLFAIAFATTRGARPIPIDRQLRYPLQISQSASVTHHPEQSNRLNLAYTKNQAFLT